jgi:predicted ferric reductase
MKTSFKFGLFIILVIHTVIWYLAFYFLAKEDIFGYYDNFFRFIIEKQGEYYATLLMTLISFNILLATRIKLLEKIFSGLDKVYVAHKYSAYFIFLLIILHNTLINSSRGQISGFFSLAKDIANPLMLAFFILIIISALPHIPVVKKIFNIPYHIWKYSHYFMGLLFLIGIYHSIGVRTLTFSNTTLSIYVYLVYTIGLVSLFYISIYFRFLKKKNTYRIFSIRKFENISCVELFLAPQSKKDKFIWKAGQFAFFKFYQDILKEIHPFTISNAPNEKGEIRLSIKVLGDWTDNLFKNLNADIEVKVDGPYGRFISDKSKNNLEIWIAGGIGITPFLAILQDYKLNNNPNKKIIFVWSVKDESEAVYKEEIEKDLPSNINFILHDTNKLGFFKFANIEEKIKTLSFSNHSKEEQYKNISLYICGPIAMREAIIIDAKKLNITDIHFEEFSFR